MTHLEFQCELIIEYYVFSPLCIPVVLFCFFFLLPYSPPPLPKAHYTQFSKFFSKIWCAILYLSFPIRPLSLATAVETSLGLNNCQGKKIIIHSNEGTNSSSCLSHCNVIPTEFSNSSY